MRNNCIDAVKPNPSDKPGMDGGRQPQVVTVTFAEYFPRSMYIDQLKKVISDIEAGCLVGHEMDPDED